MRMLLVFLIAFTLVMPTLAIACGSDIQNCPHMVSTDSVIDEPCHDDEHVNDSMNNVASDCALTCMTILNSIVLPSLLVLKTNLESANLIIGHAQVFQSTSLDDIIHPPILVS